MHLVGRTKEREILKSCLNDGKSHFLALYGRRRVGKTYLIREYLGNEFAFYATGLANGSQQEQLTTFCIGLNNQDIPIPNNWVEAFQLLIDKLEKKKTKGKKVIFIDELPWLDTPRSGFLKGLEYFWNSWASGRKDILLIGCGSAASWMINKLINNKGGLYNRVTRRIKIRPFTLNEVNEFCKAKKIKADKYQIVQLYMTLGGIPFYLDLLDPQRSIAQNINALCFEQDAPLKEEFSILFKSLFDDARVHEEIVTALSNKKIGLSKEALISKLSIKDGGGLKRILSELETSDFIRRYSYYGKKSRNTVYQLIDPFVLFHFNHIAKARDEQYWLQILNTPTLNNWQGNAFEIVSLLHINQIKTALGISGIKTSVSTWWGESSQIDLVIDRADNIVNIIEAKFSIAEYAITKSYDKNLRNKVAELSAYIGNKKTVWLSMLTSFGLKDNQYAGAIQNVLTLEDLFYE